ncbi:MAG: hypothetical protein KAW92_01125 [Candidatus Cloacimonetes bacterium]|nr:hypothetical protein [Candidatus Cloacimonadota bacterium]
MKKSALEIISIIFILISSSGFYKSEYEKVKDENQKSKDELEEIKNTTESVSQEATELFTSLKYDNKIELKFIAKDINKLENEVDKIILNNNLNVIHSKITKNYVVKLIVLPINKYKNILSDLINSPYFISEELIKSKESNSISGLKRRIQNGKEIKEEILTKIGNSQTYIELRLYIKNLNDQNNIIDVLKKELNKKEQRKNCILARIIISSKFCE